MSDSDDARARGASDDGELERRAQQAFDRSTAEVDAATRSRLTQARYRALEQLPEAPGRRIPRAWLVPAGAAAAAALVAVLLLQRSGPATDTGLEAGLAPADLEILLGEEDLEMYDEEIEFYAWLEDQPELAPAAPVGDGVG
jgi:hypothetical protein